MAYWNENSAAKHVLHVVMRWGEGRGGVKQFIRNAMDALPEDEYEQKILAIGAITGPDQGFPLIGSVVERGRSVDLLFAHGALEEKLKAINPDIVHIHCNNGLGYLYADAAMRAGCPVRIVHSHNTSTGGKGTLTRIVSSVLLHLFEDAPTERVACSRAAGDFLFGSQDFHEIRNGIDVSRFKFNKQARDEIRKNLHIAKNSIVLGHIGSGIPVKNTSFIIEILEQMRKRGGADGHVLLVGTGEEINSLRDRVDELRLNDRVHFVGTVSDPWRYYNAMDLFLLPSLYEGLPISLIEAQTSGLYCVASASISRDSDITGLVSYLPIEDEGAHRVWVERIDELAKEGLDDYERTVRSIASADAASAAGYDLASLRKVLVSLYGSRSS